MRSKPLSRPKILYIEGHSTIRNVYLQLLEYSADFELESACNGLEGLQKFDSWQPDLVLIGLRMPVLDGIETIKAIRARPSGANTPILVLSAWNTAKHKRQALAAGANGHLTPPLEIEQLVKKIRQFLGPKPSRNRQ